MTNPYAIRLLSGELSRSVVNYFGQLLSDLSRHLLACFQGDRQHRWMLNATLDGDRVEASSDFIRASDDLDLVLSFDLIRRYRSRRKDARTGLSKYT